MLLSQIRKLRELKDQYKPELAILASQGGTPNTDQELLRTLATFHLNAQLTDIIHEYFETVGEDREMFMGAVFQLSAAIGGLTGIKSKEDPEFAEYALGKADGHRLKQFLYYRRGK